jgi:hypothetical protein
VSLRRQASIESLSGLRNSLEPFVSRKSFAALEAAAVTRAQGRAAGKGASSSSSSSSSSNGGSLAASRKRGSGSLAPGRDEDGAGAGADKDGDAEVVAQPPTLTCSMRSYQLEGLSWLIDHYRRGINCILADEMYVRRIFSFLASPPLLTLSLPRVSLSRRSLRRGLGKTLQSISVIAHLVHVARVTGPHLVVVPLSVLFNWIQEFKKFCPSLKVRPYYLLPI